MAKKMVFTRMEDEDIKAIEKAANNMTDMKPSRLIRIILLDWIEKFGSKNSFK